MSNIINKVKEALHHDSSNTTGTHTTGTHTTGAHSAGTAEGVAGPHNSRIANAADPRVDSDMDGSRNAGVASGTGYSGATTGTGYSGATTGRGTGTGFGNSGTAEGMAGPHNSRIANAMDPRVDSDRDGSRNAGAATGTGYSGTTTSTGLGSGTGTTGYGTQPVHNSTILNKLDPRVDSGSHATGTTGGISSSTNAGPHDSNVANKLDPRVDSDLDGRGNRTGASKTGILGASGSHATPGSGTSQNTAGPHNSDMANKLDPRVDSDMDGSHRATRTYDGNEGSKDAAHVPPSVLRQSIGGPMITHGGVKDHSDRHGNVADHVFDHSDPRAN